MTNSAIKIFTCGGTIDKIYFDVKSDYHIGEPQALQILKVANITAEFDLVSLMKKDSLEMTDADRQIVRDAASKTDAKHIVITHGTDTMVNTGQALQGLDDKTIVITGAMQPALFHKTDAIFNVGSAIAACQALPPGVYITMNGQIFDAMRAKKNVAEHRFEST